MSKLSRVLSGIAVAAGLALALPGAAQAQHWHGGWHHRGGWHHGWRGGGFGPGLALGLGLGGLGGAYYGYGPPVYYEPEPDCGWVRERVWYYNHWSFRRVWRCW